MYIYISMCRYNDIDMFFSVKPGTHETTIGGFGEFRRWSSWSPLVGVQWVNAKHAITL